MGTRKAFPLELNSTAERPDSFVIDMDDFMEDDASVPSAALAKVQRSLSRKGSQRNNGREKTAELSSISGKDLLAITSSPRGASTPEKQPSDNQSNFQIPSTTGSTHPAHEARFGSRRITFKRYQSTWIKDPKRVLFFFATLSSIGTMILIYFTLSMKK